MRLLYVLNFFAFISVVSAFTFLPKSFRQKIMKNPLLMSNVAIVGVAGGAAETIAVRFSEEGFNVHAILDRKPFSPALNKAAADGKVETYVIDNIQSLESVIGKNGRQLGTSNILSDKSVVIIGGDDGDTMFRGARSRDQVSESNVLLDRLFKVIPPSVKGVVCTSSAVSDPITPQGLGNFLGPKGSSAWKKWCTDNSKPFSLVRFGSLTGGVSGAEPIPFVGMPLLEPELHPSYVLRSVVLADPASNKYAATEVCTRDSLAEGVVQLVKRSLSLEALMVSIAGRPPASSEWDKLFARFSTSRNAELLRVSMGAILKPQPFANWIVEQWFPQALIDADAATILTGARPVRAVKRAAGAGTGADVEPAVQIVWEDLQPDFSVKSTVGVEIRLLGGAQPAVSVVRISTSSLPGESQLVDKLLEGINKVAYKKQFCTPAAV